MNCTGCLKLTRQQASRRDFLQVGSLGFLGIQPAANTCARHPSRRANGKAQACILLWLEGGPSHVDTWDPKANSAFKPISTNVPGIQISELLPQVAKRMDKLAIVRSMHTKGNDHPQGTHYAITGHEINPAMQFPSLGSIIAKETRTAQRHSAERADAAVGEEPPVRRVFPVRFPGPDYDPMCIPDPSKKDFRVADLSLPKSVSEQAVHSRQAFLKVVDQRYRDAVRRRRTRQHGWLHGAGLEDDAESGGARGVRSWQRTRQAARSLRTRFGRPERAAGPAAGGSRARASSPRRDSTAIPGTRTAKNDEGHRDRLCPPLDRTLSALLDDLDERGLLESTVVLAMGEFGRTPFVNPDRGRDHWPTCWSLVLGGGGIKGGQVVGASDENGANVTQSHDQHGRRLRHDLQGLRHRLDEGIRHADRPADQDRQFSGRRDSRTDSRAAVRCGGITFETASLQSHSDRDSLRDPGHLRS